MKNKCNIALISLVLTIFSFHSFGQNTKIRLFTQTTAFDSIIAKNDSLIFYNQDSTHRVFIPFFDSSNQLIDSVTLVNDTLRIYEGGDTAFVEISASDADWYEVGTTSGPNAITDSIYHSGDIRITDYLNTRADDTTAHLNVLYTDDAGNMLSARREIIPPAVALNVGTAGGGNTFNYYNHYSTQMVNAGLTPIPLANLDFKVVYFESVFSSATISPTGVLTYAVGTATTDYAVMDVRFYTK